MSLFKARVTTGLLSLSALFFGIYSFVDLKELSTQQKSSRSDHVFLSFPFDELKSITLQSNDKELQLKQEEQRFFVITRDLTLKGGSASSMEEFPADTTILRQLKASLSQLNWRRQLPEPPPLSQLGLTQPRLVVTLNTERGFLRLSLGSSSVTPAHSIYAKLESDRAAPLIGVIDQEFLDGLSLEAQSYAGTRLLNVGKKKTQALTITSQLQTLDLLADDFGFHFKESGKSVDRELSDLLFLQLARTSVEKLLTPSTQTEKLFKESIVIRQLARDGSSQELHLGAPCPERPQLIAVKLKGTRKVVGCAQSLALAIINLPKERFIDRSAAPLRLDEIDRVTLSEGSTKFDLIRKNDAFDILAPKSAPLSLLEGNQFLKALLNHQGVLVSPGDARLSAWDKVEPLGTILLKSPVHSAPLLLELVERSEQGAVILRRANADYLSFAPENSWPFSAQALWARPKSVLHIKPTSIEKIIIASPAVNEEIIYKGPLRFAPPLDSKEVDPRLADDLRRALAHIDAERWLPQTTQLTTSSNTELSTISFTVDNIQNLLRLGRKIPGGQLAQLGITGTPFVLSGLLLELVQVSHASRVPAQLELAQTETLEVIGPAARLRFKATPAGLQVISGQTYPEQATSILDLCRSLTPLYQLTTRPQQLGPEKFRIKSDDQTLIFYEARLINNQVVVPAYLAEKKLYFHFAGASVNKLASLL